MATDSRGKYLFKNTFIFTIGSLATKLITFILVPLYTHMMTTQEYGSVDLITTIGMIMAPVLILNVGESVMRFSLDKNADHNQIMSTGLLALIFALLVGCLIIPVTRFFSSISEFSSYIYLYTISSAASQLFLCYLRGKEKLLLYTYGNIINTLSVALLNILFLVVLKSGIEGYLKAYILANFITAAYAFAVGKVPEVIKNFSINKNLTVAMLKYSVVLVPNVFMWWIMNSADRIIITAVMGAAANGIFAISYKIPSLMSTVAGIFNQAWAYSAIRENESEDKESYTNNVYSAFFMVISLSALGMMMILKPFLKIYVNEAFYSAWEYSPYLIIGFVFQTLGTFLSTPYTVNKDSRGFLFSAVFGAVVNIVLNCLLVFKLGLAGVAAATGISYLAVFLYRVIDTKKYIRMDVFNKKYIIIFGLMVVQAAVMYLESAMGQFLLVVLFLIGVALQYKTWKPIVLQLLEKVMGQTKRIK